MGLRPPLPVLAHLRAALPGERLAPAVRPARPGQEHVTLAFLGEVADPAPLERALAEDLGRLPAPRLRLAGGGRFRGGAVWLGLAGDLDRLQALARAAAEAATRTGVPLDAEGWRPHLTLGRGRGPVPAAVLPYEGPDAVWDDVALVRSTGGQHSDLRAWRLSGGRTHERQREGGPGAAPSSLR